MEEIFDNIKNEIFEEIMYSVWGETGNRYLKTYNKILTDSTKFLEIIKNSNNYNGKEAVENLMLQAIDNINQISSENAKSVINIAYAADRLKSMAEGLREKLNIFRT